MAYELVWEDIGVYWKYSGNVSGNEIIDASTSIYGDARFIALKYKFVDFLDVDNFKMDQSQLALIAYQHLAAENRAIRSRRWRMSLLLSSINPAGM